MLQILVDNGQDSVLAVKIDSEVFPSEGVNPVDDEILSGGQSGHC